MSENRISCFKARDGVYRARIWEGKGGLAAMLAAGEGLTRPAAIKSAKEHLARGGFKAEPAEVEPALKPFAARIMASNLAIAIDQMEAFERRAMYQMNQLGEGDRGVDTYEALARHASEAARACARSQALLAGLNLMCANEADLPREVIDVRERCAAIGVSE